MASPIRGVRFQRPKKKPVKKKPSSFKYTGKLPKKAPVGKTPKKQQVGTATKAPKVGTSTTQSRSGSPRGGGSIGSGRSGPTQGMSTLPGVKSPTTKKTTTTSAPTRSRQSTTGGLSGGTKPKTNTENTGSGQATGRGSAGIPKKGKKGPGMSAGKTVPTYNEVVRRKTGGRV